MNKNYISFWFVYSDFFDFGILYIKWHMIYVLNIWKDASSSNRKHVLYYYEIAMIAPWMVINMFIVDRLSVYVCCSFCFYWNKTDKNVNKKSLFNGAVFVAVIDFIIYCLFFGVVDDVEASFSASSLASSSPFWTLSVGLRTLI